MAHVRILAILLTALFCGCYRTYTGIYFLDRADHNATASLAAVDLEVYQAIRDLCFQEVKLEEEELEPRFRSRLFRHREEQVAEGCPRVDGAASTVLVTVGWEPPTITIRDIENNDETEFVRMVKSRIESRLVETYGLRSLRFERQADLIF